MKFIIIFEMLVALLMVYLVPAMYLYILLLVIPVDTAGFIGLQKLSSFFVSTYIIGKAVVLGLVIFCFISIFGWLDSFGIIAVLAFISLQVACVSIAHKIRFGILAVERSKSSDCNVNHVELNSVETQPSQQQQQQQQQPVLPSAFPLMPGHPVPSMEHFQEQNGMVSPYGYPPYFMPYMGQAPQGYPPMPMMYAVPYPHHHQNNGSDIPSPVPTFPAFNMVHENQQ